jgi:hypothetical protein
LVHIDVDLVRSADDVDLVVAQLSHTGIDLAHPGSRNSAEKSGETACGGCQGCIHQRAKNGEEDFLGLAGGIGISNLDLQDRLILYHLFEQTGAEKIGLIGLKGSLIREIILLA